MALFKVFLEDLCWDRATVYVEADTMAEAMAKATSPEVVRFADWETAESEATRVISVALDDEPAAELSVDDQDANGPFSAQTTLHISSLDRDPQAAQALWDQMLMERRTAQARGERKASRL